MNKRNLLIAIPVLCSGYLHGQTQPASPNVIYILMDDLGYGDIGCFGQDKIETPHIDRLCSEGIKLTQHYSGSPVSAPARCVLMTGMHSGHAQIRFNNELAERGAVNNYDSVYVHKELEGQFPLQANTMTIGRMMQQAGYTTGCFGKWGLGYPGSEGTPNKQGFDRFYGYNCQRQSHTYYPPFLYNDEERVYLSNKVTDPHRSPLDKGADPNDPYAVDALSGGTLTSRGVENMLKNCLSDYDAYIRKQRAAAGDIASSSSAADSVSAGGIPVGTGHEESALQDGTATGAIPSDTTAGTSTDKSDGHE